MANKKNYTLKTAGPDDPNLQRRISDLCRILRAGLHSTAKQKEGLENLFLHAIKPKQSRQKTLKNLIKALQDNGWKIRG